MNLFQTTTILLGFLKLIIVIQWCQIIFSLMLKRCTEVIANLTSKLLLTQKAYTRPLSYRFSLNEKERTKQNILGKDRTQPQTSKLRNLDFSPFNSAQKGQQRFDDNSNEEGTFELSSQQKLYFMKAAGLLFLVNIFLRLSMDNTRHIDSYERKL